MLYEVITGSGRGPSFRPPAQGLPVGHAVQQGLILRRGGGVIGAYLVKAFQMPPGAPPRASFADVEEGHEELAVDP